MINAHVDLQVEAPPEEVFDKLADMRNELQWNEAVTEMRKATDGEIGKGTRFEGRMKRGIGPMQMEIVEYERVRRTFSSRRRSRPRARALSSARP
jgi:uncharacterized protein YndB with AHSA1/START domain